MTREIEIAMKLWEARNAVRALYGDHYQSRTQWARELIAAVALKERCSPLAVPALLRKRAPDLRAENMLVLLAASADLAEAQHA